MFILQYTWLRCECFCFTVSICFFLHEICLFTRTLSVFEFFSLLTEICVAFPLVNKPFFYFPGALFECDLPVWRIRIILIRIRIQDVKKFVPDPGWTLIRIRIQAKTIRIRIQQNRTEYQENLKKGMKNTHNPCSVGVYYFTLLSLA